MRLKKADKTCIDVFLADPLGNRVGDRLYCHGGRIYDHSRYARIVARWEGGVVVMGDPHVWGGLNDAEQELDAAVLRYLKGKA